MSRDTEACRTSWWTFIFHQGVYLDALDLICMDLEHRVQMWFGTKLVYSFLEVAKTRQAEPNIKMTQNGNAQWLAVDNIRLRFACIWYFIRNSQIATNRSAFAQVYADEEFIFSTDQLKKNPRKPFTNIYICKYNICIFVKAFYWPLLFRLSRPDSMNKRICGGKSALFGHNLSNCIW